MRGTAGLVLAARELRALAARRKAPPKEYPSGMSGLIRPAQVRSLWVGGVCVVVVGVRGKGVLDALRPAQLLSWCVCVFRGVGGCGRAAGLWGRAGTTDAHSA